MTLAMTNNDLLDAIEKAHGRSVDAAAGFQKMVEKAEPAFREVASRFLGLHLDHAHRLARLLSDHGRTVDPDGSFMGDVNQAVVSLRAMFDEIDEDVLAQIRSGETWIVSAFEEAIDKADGAEVSQPISRMHTELTHLIEETRYLD